MTMLRHYASGVANMRLRIVTIGFIVARLIIASSPTRNALPSPPGQQGKGMLEAAPLLLLQGLVPLEWVQLRAPPDEETLELEGPGSEMLVNGRHAIAGTAAAPLYAFGDASGG